MPVNFQRISRWMCESGDNKIRKRIISGNMSWQRSSKGREELQCNSPLAENVALNHRCYLPPKENCPAIQLHYHCYLGVSVPNYTLFFSLKYFKYRLFSSFCCIYLQVKDWRGTDDLVDWENRCMSCGMLNWSYSIAKHRKFAETRGAIIMWTVWTQI